MRSHSVQREDDRGWANPRVLTLLAVIFVCGIALGSAVTRSYLHLRRMRSANPVHLEQLRLKELETKLNLTPQQEQIVTKELDDYAKYYQNIEEQRGDVAAHGRQNILNVLTPEQAQRFKRLLGEESP